MRLIIFALAFMLLLAAGSLAKGLELTEIKVHVDYDEAYTYKIENIDRIRVASVPLLNGSKINADIMPGSNVTFTLDIENTFKDMNLKEVFASISVHDIDDGSDLTQEGADFDLDAGYSQKTDLKIKVPFVVEARAYNVSIIVEGRGSNDTTQRAKINLRMGVKKQNHDIRITKVSLIPSVASCDRKLQLTAEASNSGNNAESNVALEFSSAMLGIDSIDNGIYLASSNDADYGEKTHVKNLNINLPRSIKAGAYPIIINLYWEGNSLFDKKIMELTVKECSSFSSAKSTAAQEQNNETEPAIAQLENEPMQVNENYLNGNHYLILAFLGAFAIAILGGMVFYLIYKHKNIS